MSLSPQFIQANVSFGVGLLQQTAKREQGNVFMSPANVAIALAMTANGAKGETFDSMRNLIAAPGASVDQMNADYSVLQSLLRRSDDTVSMSLANALWARAGVPFDEVFLVRAKDSYSAQVSELNFDNPKAPETINQWVRANTNDKINGIVDKLDPSLVLLLTSAIHFKGAWLQTFDKASTVDMLFNLPDGVQKPTPMMLRVGPTLHLKTDMAQAVQLPYADESLRMVVVLPNPDSDVNVLVKSLSGEQWLAWRESFTPKSGTLYLPRFKVETDLTLNDSLGAMGMEAAFDPERADFTGMRPAPPQLAITSVQHKAFVEVNEEGTEAAAVTSVGVGATSAQPRDDSFEMIVDRPFLIAIEDAKTGALLFVGIVREP